jgi:hypothetical protein
LSLVGVLVFDDAVLTARVFLPGMKGSRSRFASKLAHKKMKTMIQPNDGIAAFKFKRPGATEPRLLDYSWRKGEL